MTTHLSAEVVTELRRLLDKAVMLPHGWAGYRSEFVPAEAIAALLDAAEAARETTPAEVGLREAVEALVAECDRRCERSEDRVLRFWTGRLRALLAEHPAPAPEAEVAAGEREVLDRAIRTLLPGLRCANYVERWSPISPAVQALNILCEHVGENPEPAGDEIDAHVPTAHHRRPAGDPATPPADDATPAPAEPKTAEVDAGDVETSLVITSLVAGRVSGPEAIAALDRQIAALLDRERRAERERTLRETLAELERMLDTFPAKGRHTRARWATEWIRHIIARADALGAAGEGTGGAG